MPYRRAITAAKPRDRNSGITQALSISRKPNRVNQKLKSQAARLASGVELNGSRI